MMVTNALNDENELRITPTVYDFAAANPMMQRIWRFLGFEMDRQKFLAHKEQVHLLTFEPTDKPTPPPLAVDLE